MSGDPTPADGSIQVVMFYAFRRPDPETAELIALLAESVRLHEPGCEVVLLTNADGARSGVPRSVRVELCDVDPEHVMVERLRLFRDHLRSVRPGTTLVFMDTDMIALRPFVRAMLAPGADLCVTVRRDPVWPINAGIIAVRTHDHPRVLALFDALLACCGEMPEKERRWYGDQVALAEVLRPIAGRFRLAYVEERMGCRVRFVPAASSTTRRAPGCCASESSCRACASSTSRARGRRGWRSMRGATCRRPSRPICAAAIANEGEGPARSRGEGRPALAIRMGGPYVARGSNSPGEP